MSIEFVIELYREMIRTTALVAAPILGTAMAVGLGISILQTITSVNEQTLTFVPKIASIALVIGIMLPWILTNLMNFLTLVITHSPGLVLAQ